MRKNQPSPGRTFSVNCLSTSAFASFKWEGKCQGSLRIKGCHSETQKNEDLVLALNLSLDQLIELRNQISTEIDNQLKLLVEMMAEDEGARVSYRGKLERSSKKKSSTALSTSLKA